MKKIIIVLLSLLITSCSLFESTRQTDKRRIRKAKAKIEKAVARSPELAVSDTVWNTITVPVESIKLDSFFVIKTVQGECPDLDSVMMYNQDSTTKVVIRQVTVWRDSGRVDTFRVEVECLPDDITLNVPTEVNTNIDASKGFNAKDWIIVVLFFVLVAAIINALKK